MEISDKKAKLYAHVSSSDVHRKLSCTDDILPTNSWGNMSSVHDKFSVNVLTARRMRTDYMI